MKADAAHEVIDGKANEAEANAIGREFVKQYYELLHKSPSAVHRFYGHESTFVHNDTSLTGQKSIGASIEDLFPKDSSIKIYSVKGSQTFNQGVVLQVCGEISSRKFIQTFVLAQQSQKKFYVQNDIFQYLDSIFEKTTEKANEVLAKLNGHEAVPKPVPAPVPAEEEPVRTSPIVPTEYAAKVTKAQHVSTSVAAPAPIVENVPAAVPKTEEFVAPVVEPEPESTPVPEPVVEEPKQSRAPSSWAKLVEGSAAKTSSSSNATAPNNVASSAPTTNGTSAPTQNPRPFKQHNGGPTHTSQKNGPIATGERKIYLGQITRNIVPESLESAETEIKEIFSKYGEVESVSIPRKVLDYPNDVGRPAFAFITMKSAQEAANVYSASKLLNNGTHALHLKIDSFGFNGEAFVSEQRDREDRGGPRQGGFRGGRGGFQPRGGAQNSYGGGPRGGGGYRGGSRGGFRGGFHPGQQAQPAN